jgi:hypothetical protein
MEKFKLANGWTKETVMAQIKKYNNGSRSMIEGYCLYEGPDGNRCAIGCFIPDGHEALNRGYNSAPTIMRCYPELQKLMPFAESCELLEFQSAHDECDGKGMGVYDAIQDFLDTKVE